MTISALVRGALQVRASTVVGFPASANRVFEGLLPGGKPYQPVKGTNYVRMFIVPSSISRTDLSNQLFRHEGLFQISVFVESGKGTSILETLSDSIRAQFKPGLRITTSANRLFIRSCDKGPILEEPDWLQLPITIGWRYYSTEA